MAQMAEPWSKLAEPLSELAETLSELAAATAMVVVAFAYLFEPCEVSTSFAIAADASLAAAANIDSLLASSWAIAVDIAGRPLLAAGRRPEVAAGQKASAPRIEGLARSSGACEHAIERALTCTSRPPAHSQDDDTTLA